MEWTVNPNESGSKLLAFLKAKLGEEHSAKSLKKAIEANLCEINGRVERFASTILGNGDRIKLNLSNISPKKTLSPPILYQDSELLILNKPAGIESENADLAKIGGYLVHRLDKGTTGVLIFAKNKAMRELMFDLFRQHQIKKTYLALVDGIPRQSSGVIENTLGKLHEYQGQTLWGAVENGLYAYTEWHLERSLKNIALLRCHPKTGRTHQIRTHLNSIGHPILGDHQYGRHFKSPLRPPRPLLHALSITFTHPSSHLTLTIEAPLPDDFRFFLGDSVP